MRSSQILGILSDQLAKQVVIQSDPKDKDTDEEKKKDESNLIDGFSASVPISVDIAVTLERQPIGRGGFADVYKANYGGATIAVKQLRNFAYLASRGISKELALSEFRNGCAKLRALKDFSLSCAVGFIAYREDSASSTYQVLMQFIEGETLTQLANKHRSYHDNLVPPVKAAEYAVGVTASCNEVLNKGILHCDLKPDNIKRNKEGRFIFLDWDFALFLGKKPKLQKSTRRGSPGFMGPEVIKSMTYSEASEVFAATSVVYTLTNQGEPFGFGDTAKAPDSVVCSFVMSKGRAELDRGCHPLFKDLIGKGWNQDPAKRPTMQKLHDECKAIFETEKKRMLTK
jgi:serine/threonine protein kinase